MHKPTHLRSNLVKAASSILTEGRKIEVPRRAQLTEGVGNYSVKVTGKKTEDSEEGKITITKYAITKDSKVVGELDTNDHTGYVNGKLHGKNLPELSSYGRGKDSGALSNLHSFLKSKTGQKWMSSVKEDLDESADPVKNSKGLHNSPKPLGQATVKELEASKKWYQETIEKHKETTPSFSVRLKQLLTLVNTELASRIGKKNESVELDEGFFRNLLVKAAASAASAKDIADAWYAGADSEMKKLKSLLNHDNVEKFMAASLALSRVRDEARALKSGREAITFLGDAAKIEALIKKHTEEIMKKGVLNMKEELDESTARHTPNVTKAMNFAKGFEAAEMESFLLELAEYFMYSHDDMSNAQGVGSLLKKAYTEWKRRKKSKNEDVELEEAKADIASGRLETQARDLVNNDWIIKSHTQDVTKQIAIYKSSIKSLKEYLLLDPGLHSKSFVDHKQIKARIQIFEKALAAAEKYQASLK